jgi:hypothetical protein
MYNQHYLEQAGSGIAGFAGHRYHVGKGFGKVLKKLMPALKYIGRQGWDAFKTMGRDVMSGENLATAGQNTLINTAQNILNDASTKLNNYKKTKQTGSGKRKRKQSFEVKSKKRKVSKKVYKTQRRVKRKVKRKKVQNITNFL